ncbi:amidohydrolase family protein [Amycolatopsis sp. H20-H5]|uniref:amidohydrolase family protein n=1 Tax=Amycolatopsis sp. H20-H5 TaxID=3046309 RepID=UPI002DBD50E3|nr:amidohydrolase family protein [Amycolatopsis sp. H20-H5]MEC3975479.1 amidohydrolase family protein [Amycolatopsis sp. H20-H5]
MNGLVTVDVHAHCFVGEIDALVAGAPGLAHQQELEARRNGPESLAVSGEMIRERIPKLTSPERRLSDMDGCAVDVQMVSPSPSHYHYWADPELAGAISYAANRAVAAMAAAEPQRLGGFGLVPLQHPDLLVKNLDDALGLGLAGVEIGSYAPGVELSDERLEPFWARAAETGAVVFLHPFGCSLDERLDRFYLSNTVGQPVENAVALSQVIFAGVLDRHPELKILAAHGGGYLPGHLGRSDHAWRVRPEARRCAEPPSHYLRRLWFDSLVHSRSVLRGLVEAAGPDRVLLGSDYPFDMGAADPLAALGAADLGPEVYGAIAGGNAVKLGLRPGEVNRWTA